MSAYFHLCKNDNEKLGISFQQTRMASSKCPFRFSSRKIEARRNILHCQCMVKSSLCTSSTPFTSGWCYFERLWWKWEVSARVAGCSSWGITLHWAHFLFHQPISIFSFSDLLSFRRGDLNEAVRVHVWHLCASRCVAFISETVFLFFIFNELGFLLRP